MNDAIVGNILRRASPPEMIGVWSWGELTLQLYAYKAGKAGTENKHELPPPHDTILLFGEAVVVAVKNGVVQSFNTTAYTKFSNEAMGGFEDLGSDTETETEEEEEEEVEEDEEDVEEVEEEEAEAEAEVEVPLAVKKVKRGAKKVQNWYLQPELEPDVY